MCSGVALLFWVLLLLLFLKCICFWLNWILISFRGLSLVAASGATLFWCEHFSLRCFSLSGSTGSRAQASVVIACGLGSYDEQA